MNRAEAKTISLGLPATSHVVQWGESDVYKVVEIEDGREVVRYTNTPPK